MMILGLNTLGIIIETGLGIWIFSKAFPRRADDEWGWKEVVNEAVLHGIMFSLIFHNFFQGWGSDVKAGIIIGWIAAIVGYRYTIVKKQMFSNAHIQKIDLVLSILEWFSACGFLAWNYWQCYISIGMVWLANIFLPFFFYKRYKCKIYQAYIWNVFYLVTVQIMKCAYMAYKGAAEQKTLMELNYNGGMHTFVAVIIPLAVYGAIFFLTKCFPVYDVVNKMLGENKKWMVLTAIGESIILNFFTDLIRWENIAVYKAKIIIIISALIVIFIVTGLILLFRKSMLAEQEVLFMKNEAIKKQYEELRKAYEQNRCLIHDEKHRMQFIEECLENGDIERAKIFIQNAHNDMKKSKGKTWTGIPTLDFLFNMKCEQMDRLHVEFKLHVTLDRIPIEEGDFIVLLGNLLDNAIEAVEKCEVKQRVIELKIKQINNMFMILIKNSNAVLPIQKDTRFVSSKKDSFNHGYGIASVKSIVDKYSGETDFVYDKNMFQARINIIVGQEKSE